MSEKREVPPTEAQVNIALQVLLMELGKSAHPQARDLLCLAVCVIHDALAWCHPEPEAARK